MSEIPLAPHERDARPIAGSDRDRGSAAGDPRLVLPLGLAGLVLAAPCARRLLPLYALAATLVLALVVTFVTWRYRLPLVLALFPFAGHTLALALALLLQAAEADPGQSAVWREIARLAPRLGDLDLARLAREQLAGPGPAPLEPGGAPGVVGGGPE